MLDSAARQESTVNWALALYIKVKCACMSAAVLTYLISSVSSTFPELDCDADSDSNEGNAPPPRYNFDFASISFKRAISCPDSVFWAAIVDESHPQLSTCSDRV